MAIRINTADVDTTAIQIEKINKQISVEYGDTAKKVRSMCSEWEGAGSESAMRMIKRITFDYADRREAVISDMVRFMHGQVSDNYEGTEAAVSSAASAFK